jgi:ectoine hydroxylase-related dioxygenase (phytanoyl-CoA dioxygenase family)
MLEADILKCKTTVLSKEQREQFFEDGYLVVDDVVDRSWVDRLRDAMEEMIERSRSFSESDTTFVLEEGHTPDNPRLRRLSSPVAHHPTFWDFAAQSKSADVAADLCGPDVKFHHSKLNFKWPKGGQLFDWHQDIQAWPHTDYSPVTIGVYLNDCGLEQGPLLAVKGSHKEPLRSMYDKNGNWVLRIDEEDMPENWSQNTAALTASAGSLVILNCRVIHGSRRNASDHMRPLLLNVYSSADSMPYTFNPIPSGHAGTIVRGEAARKACHDPRGCELPPDWSKGYSGPWKHQATGKESAETGM